MTPDEVIECCKNYWINNKVIPCSTSYGIWQSKSGVWKPFEASEPHCCAIGAFLVGVNTKSYTYPIDAAVRIIGAKRDEVFSFERGFTAGYCERPHYCCHNIIWYDAGYKLGVWALEFLKENYETKF